MARVDKKPCYRGDTQIDLVAASQIAYLRGGQDVREWVPENNPCPSLFEKWGAETEASRAALVGRELDEDYQDSDDMSPTFLANRKMYNALTRHADIPDLSNILRKLKLNNKIMSLAPNWTTGSAAKGTLYLTKSTSNRDVYPTWMRHMG